MRRAEGVFCPYPVMKRQKGTMRMELFRKIIDEAVSLPLIDAITFTGLGETLLDKFLIERIQYTRAAMPAIPIDIYTNGTYLTREKAEALRDAGLSLLYVSLNAVNKEKRQQIMFPDQPGYYDFDDVCDTLDYIIPRAGKMRVIVKGIVSKDLMEGGDSEAFRQRWNGPTTEDGNAFLHLEGNWAGAQWPMRVKPVTSCSRALGQIMVLQDGRVSLCCFDNEGDVILGDLNTQTIREVYNGDKALNIRLAHVEGRRGELQLCRTCTAI